MGEISFALGSLVLNETICPNGGRENGALIFEVIVFSGWKGGNPAKCSLVRLSGFPLYQQMLVVLCGKVGDLIA